MVLMQVVSYVCATSRPIASDYVLFHPEMISPETSENRTNGPIVKPNKSREKEKGRRIGSKPPICEKRCYGCEPCVAIQVPTISSSIPHLSPYYANYQPEGWICHCSP
ncbi:unnamed protein product [Cochlearia groenlandica]